MTTRINGIKALGLLAAAALSMAVSSAQAGETVSVEASADVVSKYVWRGMLLNDEPVVQPGATISAYGLSLNVWASTDLTDVNEGMGDEYKTQELDFTASYAISPIDGLDLEGGYIYYTFPGVRFDNDGNGTFETDAEDTAEVYGSIALSSIPLSPTLTVYYDVDEVEGFYGALSIGHSFAITEALSLDLGASVGYADDDYNVVYFGVDDDGFNDLTVSAGLCYTVNENFSVGATVTYSELLDSDIEDNADSNDWYNDSDVVTVGLNITLSY